MQFLTGYLGKVQCPISTSSPRFSKKPCLIEESVRVGEQGAKQ